VVKQMTKAKHAGRGHQKVTNEKLQEFIKRNDEGEHIQDLAKEVTAGISPAALGQRMKRWRDQNNPTEPHKQSAVVRQLEQRVSELEEENERLKQALEPQKGSPGRSPRRDQIMDTLDDVQLMTYQEIGDIIGCSDKVVKGTINSMEPGEIQKFKGEDGKAYVRKQQ